MIPAVVLAVGLHVEKLEELTFSEARPAIEAFADAVRREQQVEVQLDDAGWDCDAADRCLGELRARTRASDIVYIRAVGGPSRIQLRLERIDNLGQVRTAEVLVDRTPGLSNSVLMDTARALFPEPASAKPAADPVTTISPTTQPPRDPPYLAWSLLGGGVVVAGVGAGFFASYLDARDTISGGVLLEPAYEDALSRGRTHGNTSAVLFAGGAALVITGGVLLLGELLD